MNIENEQQKFKQQYEKQWSRLCANLEFKKAWDSGNIVKAGEIANIVIEGDEPNIKEARLQRAFKNGLGDLISD
ncbi:MAG: hypothetical protein ABSC89_16180 [Verrucomicrobiota bacterium]|jgi:hypothetical protein